MTDGKYSLLLSENLLYKHSFRLDSFFKEQLKNPITEHKIAHTIFFSKRHAYLLYPIGSPILSIPIVAVCNFFGLSSINNNEAQYSTESEEMISRIVASFLMALFSVICFSAARLYLGVSQSLTLTAALSLGSQVSSTLALGLWQQTWGVFLLMTLVFILMKNENEKYRKIPLFLIISVNFLIIFTRPNLIAQLLVIMLYLFLKFKEKRKIFIVSTAIWCVTYFGISYSIDGSFIPQYLLMSGSKMDLSIFLEGMFGALLSPSRGMIIYVPMVVIPVYLVIKYRQNLKAKPLLLLGLSCSLLHLAMISAYSEWWAGASYGSRYTAELIPWLMMAFIFGLDARQNFFSQKDRQYILIKFERLIFYIIILLGIMINLRGAMSEKTWHWNTYPYSITDNKWRLFDYKEPQFLAGICLSPKPRYYNILPLGEEVEINCVNASNYLCNGWQWQRGNFQKLASEGNFSEIYFGLTELSTDKEITFKIAPDLRKKGNGAGETIIDVSFNNDKITTLKIRKEGAYSVILPKNKLKGENMIKFGYSEYKSPLFFSIIRKNMNVFLSSIKLENKS